VSDLVCQGRSGWFGHVDRKDVEDWVSACRNMAVLGERGKTDSENFARNFSGITLCNSTFLYRHDKRYISAVKVDLDV
jgi:hypothetical protein